MLKDMASSIITKLDTDWLRKNHEMIHPGSHVPGGSIFTSPFSIQ